MTMCDSMAIENQCGKQRRIDGGGSGSGCGACPRNQLLKGIAAAQSAVSVKLTPSLLASAFDGLACPNLSRMGVDRDRGASPPHQQG